MNNPLDEYISEAQTFLTNHGLPTVLIIVLIFVLYVAANNPENFKIYFGAIWHLLAGPFKFLRKKAIKFQIEGPLTKSLKSIAREVPDVDIPTLEINWVKSEEFATKLTEGKAIIKLKFEEDNSKNLIKATSIYVRDAFLVSAKPYLSESLTKAIDFTITKKILLNASIKNNSSVIPQFIIENKYLGDEVFEKCDKLEEVDDNGLFTRVILKELNYLGEKFFGRTPKIEHRIESDEFLNFIHTLVVRDYDENTPLMYNKNVFKIGFLLVAKTETYLKHGLEAYYRRIRLSLAEGVKSFYLLARHDKVAILEKVANELLQTGNFILKNTPKEYVDNLNRRCVCYNLEVNSDSILTTTLSQIGQAIQEKSTIIGVISSVRENKLLIDINGISGEVKKHNLSSGEIHDARNYFNEKTDIELLPLEILEGGHINFSLRNTKSDPLNFIKSNFEIGKIIIGKVRHIDDNFIKVDIGHEVIDGIAFRKDLTFSKYIFLHDKFNIDEKYDFLIKDYDFSKGRLILQLEGLKDPWLARKFKKSQNLNFFLTRKSKNSFIGEVEEGVEALIPKYELGWTNEEQEKTFQSTSLGSVLNCSITNIEDRLLILSSKIKNHNPYEQFFEEKKDTVVRFTVIDINEYGIIGNINNLEIYIPKYELSWNGNHFKYFVGKQYDVFIKDLGKNKNKLIGSFKPLLKHPLEDFKKRFTEGSVLKKLTIHEIFDWGIVYNIQFKNKKIDGLLLIKNISNECFVNDINKLAPALNNIPLMISEINLGQNKVILSLKDLLRGNLDRLEQLDYANEYDSIIIGKKNNNYVVLIPNIWIEGILETSIKYNAGDKITVRPSIIDSSFAYFTDN